MRIDWRHCTTYGHFRCQYRKNTANISKGRKKSFLNTYFSLININF